MTSDSPAQRALAHRFAAAQGVELVGVLVQRIEGTRRASWVRRVGLRQPWRLASKVLQRTVLRSSLLEILGAEAALFGERTWADVPMAIVEDVNGHEAVTFVVELAPDAIAVSGTKLVKQPIFDLAPPLGLLNLHTGISPYVKGGPNCTLWCLAERTPHLVGVTVHVLDPGIDSGPIVATAQLQIEGTETVGELVAATMALGHDHYVASVERLARHRALPSVPQATLGEGRTFFAREWDVRQLVRALRYVRSGELRRWVETGRPGLADVRLVTPD